MLSLNQDFKTLIEGLTLPMNEEQLYRNQKSQFQYEIEGNKQLNRSFIGLMQHKTNDLTRFLEIKHRYWKLFTTQLPKSSLTIIRNLFKSEQRIYLFRSFDQSDDQQNQIVQSLKPIFFSQGQMQQLAPAQL
jgi:hypothetical protein